MSYPVLVVSGSPSARARPRTIGRSGAVRTRDGVWRETGLIEQFAQPQIAWKWSVPIGPGYCGPTVADGRVVVMDRQTDPRRWNACCASTSRPVEPLWTHAYPCEYRRCQLHGRAAGQRHAGRRPRLCAGDDGASALPGAAHGEVLWQRDLRTGLSDPHARCGALRPRPWCVEESGHSAHRRPPRRVRRGTRQDERPGTLAGIRRSGFVQCTDHGAAGRANRSSSCGTGTRSRGWLRRPARYIGVWSFRRGTCRSACPRRSSMAQRVFVSSFYDGSYMVELSGPPPTARKLWSQCGANERQHTGTALHDQHTAADRRAHLRRGQLRRTAVSAGRYGRARLGRPDGDARERAGATSTWSARRTGSGCSTSGANW